MVHSIAFDEIVNELVNSCLSCYAEAELYERLGLSAIKGLIWLNSKHCQSIGAVRLAA